MSRRLTSFLSLLLAALFSVPALAQLEELSMKAVQIGSAAESVTPDTQWYLVYNNAPGVIEQAQLDELAISVNLPE